jgi:hypothetical protein
VSPPTSNSQVRVWHDKTAVIALYARTDATSHPPAGVAEAAMRRNLVPPTRPIGDTGRVNPGGAGSGGGGGEVVADADELAVGGEEGQRGHLQPVLGAVVQVVAGDRGVRREAGAERS